MLGAEEAYHAVPWFWSDQHGLGFQIAGLPDEGRSAVKRDPGDGAFTLFHLSADGRLVAASGIGPGNAVARDVRLAEMLIAGRTAPAGTLPGRRSSSGDKAEVAPGTISRESAAEVLRPDDPERDGRPVRKAVAKPDQGFHDLHGAPHLQLGAWSMASAMVPPSRDRRVPGDSSCPMWTTSPDCRHLSRCRRPPRRRCRGSAACRVSPLQGRTP